MDLQSGFVWLYSLPVVLDLIFISSLLFRCGCGVGVAGKFPRLRWTLRLIDLLALLGSLLDLDAWIFVGLGIPTLCWEV